jgi:hypothetical protein
MRSLMALTRDVVFAVDSGASVDDLRVLLRWPAAIAAIRAAPGLDHILGFGQIRIGEHNGRLVRLHFWRRSARRTETVHSHRRTLTSYVLAGSLVSVGYDIQPGENGTYRLWEVRNEGLGSRRMPSNEIVTCEEASFFETSDGDSYTVAVGDYHRSMVANDIGITLVVTGNPGSKPPYLVGPLDPSGRDLEVETPARLLTVSQRTAWIDTLQRRAL